MGSSEAAGKTWFLAEGIVALGKAFTHGYTADKVRNWLQEVLDAFFSMLDRLREVLELAQRTEADIFNERFSFFQSSLQRLGRQCHVLFRISLHAHSTEVCFNRAITVYEDMEYDEEGWRQAGALLQLALPDFRMVEDLVQRLPEVEEEELVEEVDVDDDQDDGYDSWNDNRDFSHFRKDDWLGWITDWRDSIFKQ